MEVGASVDLAQVCGRQLVSDGVDNPRMEKWRLLCQRSLGREYPGERLDLAGIVVRVVVDPDLPGQRRNTGDNADYESDHE